MALTDEQVSVFLSRPLTARIAAIDPQTMQPHVLQVWFLWDGNEIWISGFRGKRRFSELEENRKCSIVVDDDENASTNGGILLEGEVELVAEPRDLVENMSVCIYRRYLDERVIQLPETQASITDPENVIYRLKPVEIYCW